MRYRIYRHLAAADHAEALSGDTVSFDSVRRPTEDDDKRPDMTWKDHLAMLLHIGAEIEHSLMVQYLYAAYSLGGEQVPPEHRARVARWQASILAVAKEEMGHLLTVQNILTLVGAPINLDRQDLPWDGPFYPFPFQLERLTLESLARYVYAEMPAEAHCAATRAKHPQRELLERVIERATKDTRVTPHHVGKLYHRMIDVIGRSGRIPDSMFQEHTYASQAASDDWGRGYQPDPRLLDAGGSLVEPAARSDDAHVIIDRVATRDQALDALKALSQQGEAPISATRKEGEPPSHFHRLLAIYAEFEGAKDWQPARCVPVNPTTLHDPDHPDHPGYIGATQSREWASLFNLRYRMLLRYLAHTFRLARVTLADSPNLRAMVMHRVFGEMYNLKTIAGILVRLPVRDGDGTNFAGPPFEMPYSMHLAETELDVWMNHRDLIASSQHLCITLRESGAGNQPYLGALLDLDTQARAWMDRIIAGLGSSERPFS
jgi:hypothetical protein